MGNMLAQQMGDMRATLASPRVQEQISNALARVGWDADRFTRMVFTCLSKNPDLAKCSKSSFIGAVIQAAEAGLSPSAYGGECYILPYKEKATFIPGYRGLMKLAWRSEKVLEFHADVVREGDHFVNVRGSESRMEHTPGDADEMDDSNITHAYAYAKLVGGGFQFAVMTRRQILAVQNSSASARARMSPWKSHWAEMAKKTAVRRLAKMLPLSVDDMRVIDQAGMEEGGRPDVANVSIPDAPNVDATVTDAPETVPPSEPEIPADGYTDAPF